MSLTGLESALMATAPQSLDCLQAVTSFPHDSVCVCALTRVRHISVQICCIFPWVSAHLFLNRPTDVFKIK